MMSFFAKGYPQKIWERAYFLKEKMRGFPKMHAFFYHNHGYQLDLKQPFTHNQRIVHKMIMDRNPLIVLTSDKVRVREYVKEMLGEKLSNDILIPLYFVSKTGNDIPLESWNFEFFMKANHGSGFNKLVLPGDDPAEVRQLAKYWLSQSFGQSRHEWAYRDIPRRIICEEVLRTPENEIPADFKYYCFNGAPKMILVLTDRFKRQKRVFVDENLNLLEGSQMYGNDVLWPLPPIPNHARMLDLASKLAQPFTYCRVDFYSIGDRVYLGEITHYSGAGAEKFDDYDLDVAFGELWKKENRHRSVLEILVTIKSHRQ